MKEMDILYFFKSKDKQCAGKTLDKKFGFVITLQRLDKHYKGLKLCLK